MTASKKSHAKKLVTYVALLRGINVGGNALIKMDALRATFEAIGFVNVSTFIASGNVLFRSTMTDPRKIELTIEAALGKKHGLKEACVVVRSLVEYEAMTKKQPKGWNADPKKYRYYVIFLRHGIDDTSVLGQLDANPDVETLSYVPGAVLWQALIAKLTRSKTNRVVLKKDIYRQITIRNGNTAAKLLELLRQTDAKP